MLSAVADALLPAPRNPAQLPQGFWGNAGNFAYEALGLGDVAKALRGQMTPTEAQDFAFGAALGLLPMSKGLKPVQRGIRAYHGSPHDFDRFDMSKIGTGEGAQAYGHGLYFAEKEAVAREYRDALSQGKSYGNLLMDESLPKPGRMYEVNINAHPDQFLDWDKPLSGQSDKVRTALDPLFQKYYSGVNETHKIMGDLPAPSADDVMRQIPGSEIHQRLVSGRHRKINERANASQELLERGIPGIKYLDQGSRTAGEGSRNYVVFDDKLIDIVRKYGLAALGLLPALASQQEAPAQ